MNPDEVGGAVLFGVDGVVVKKLMVLVMHMLFLELLIKI